MKGRDVIWLSRNQSCKMLNVCILNDWFQELDKQLQSREGYFSISPVSAAILGAITLHEEFKGTSIWILPFFGLFISIVLYHFVFDYV